MTPEKDLAQKAVENLETLAPQAWELLVRGVIVNGVAGAISYTLLTVALILASRFFWGKAKDPDVFGDEGAIMGMLAVISLIIAVLTTTGLVQCVAKVAFPEPYAASLILHAVK